jgi:hypothetical protein
VLLSVLLYTELAQGLSRASICKVPTDISICFAGNKRVCCSNQSVGPSAVPPIKFVVQVPMPSEDDEGTVPNKRSKATGGWQEQTSRSSSQRQQQAAAAGPAALAKKPRDPNFVEVQQYIKYFHLVPAQVRM